MKYLIYFLDRSPFFEWTRYEMNANKFLPPPVRLSQALEPENSSGGGAGHEITRRSFIKRTGGATVATLVAWNLASQNAIAAGDCLGSCSHLVEATPNAATQDVEFVNAAGVTAFARVTCDPAGQPTKSKVLKIIGGGYEGAKQTPHPDGAATMEQYSVTGQIVNNSPDGCFSTSCVVLNNGADCYIKQDETHKWYARVTYVNTEFPSGTALHHKFNFKIQVIKMERIFKEETVEGEAAFSIELKLV